MRAPRTRFDNCEFTMPPLIVPTVADIARPLPLIARGRRSRVNPIRFPRPLPGECRRQRHKSKAPRSRMARANRSGIGWPGRARSIRRSWRATIIIGTGKTWPCSERSGIPNYRLSVAWPRIFPQGDGAPNPKGLEFYDRLIDALLENGVTPWITLYHWDLPQALEDRGGWRVRATPQAFGRYAQLVVQRLGDRVKNWMSVNEILRFVPCRLRLRA